MNNAQLNKQNKIKLEAFASYSGNKSNFEVNGAQNYLAFQSMYRYLKTLLVLVVANMFLFSKSKGYYILYQINKNFPISSQPTPENCLFGAVSLTKSNYIDSYKYILGMTLDLIERESFQQVMDLETASFLQQT